MSRGGSGVGYRIQRFVAALLVARGRCWTAGRDGWFASAGKSCWSVGGAALGTAETGLDLAACKVRCSQLFGCNAVLHEGTTQLCAFSRQPVLPECSSGTWPSFTSLWIPFHPCEDSEGDCGSQVVPGKCISEARFAKQCRSACGTCASSAPQLVPWTWLTSGAGCTVELAESECKAVAAQLGVAWRPSPEELKSSSASCFEETQSGSVVFFALAPGACSTSQRCICREESLPFDPASLAVSYVDRHGCGMRGPYAQACVGRQIVREVQSVAFRRDGAPVATIGGCEYDAYSVYQCSDRGDEAAAPTAPAMTAGMVPTSSFPPSSTTPTAVVSSTTITVTSSASIVGSASSTTAAVIETTTTTTERRRQPHR